MGSGDGRALCGSWQTAYDQDHSEVVNGRGAQRVGDAARGHRSDRGPVFGQFREPALADASAHSDSGRPRGR